MELLEDVDVCSQVLVDPCPPPTAALALSMELEGMLMGASNSL